MHKASHSFVMICCVAESTVPNGTLPSVETSNDSCGIRPSKISERATFGPFDTNWLARSVQRRFLAQVSRRPVVILTKSDDGGLQMDSREADRRGSTDALLQPVAQCLVDLHNIVAVQVVDADIEYLPCFIDKLAMRCQCRTTGLKFDAFSTRVLRQTLEQKSQAGCLGEYTPTEFPVSGRKVDVGRHRSIATSWRNALPAGAGSINCKCCQTP
jgi:hypothetical protein